MTYRKALIFYLEIENNMDKKGTYFIVNLGIFPFDIMFSVNESDATLLKRLRKYGVDNEELLKFVYDYENSNGRTKMFSTNHTVIRLSDFDDRYKFIGTLSHEIFHAVTFIYDRIGIKYELGVSDEAYSYAIGYVTRIAYEKLGL